MAGKGSAPPATLGEVRERAAGVGPIVLAVVGSDGGSAVEAARRAAASGLVEPVFLRDPDEAAGRAGAGEIDVLLKGTVRSDQLLRAVLDRAHSLRTDRLLSDVLLYEDTLSGRRRLVGVTDGGVTVAPDGDQLRQIVLNAVGVFHALGFAEPRVALLSATEAVSESVPSTVRARALADEAIGGGLGRCHVQGPLALDNALLPSAAEAKGIVGPVAGRADVLVTSGIEAGNILGKSVKYFAGSVTGHVVVGARVPVLIPSRVESVEDKLASIALGALAARGMR
ncbi:MAG: phosphate acyltransferase [Gemmatimonadota bacterium]|jgi:phosphate butyryltransferase